VAEKLKLYLDQMFAVGVADALRAEGHDVTRASETGQSRSDDKQVSASSSILTCPCISRFRDHMVIFGKAPWILTA
jgi:hypothetical protein